jgi:hypothetical protein
MHPDEVVGEAAARGQRRSLKADGDGVIGRDIRAARVVALDARLHDGRASCSSGIGDRQVGKLGFWCHLVVSTRTMALLAADPSIGRKGAGRSGTSVGPNRSPIPGRQPWCPRWTQACFTMSISVSRGKIQKPRKLIREILDTRTESRYMLADYPIETSRSITCLTSQTNSLGDHLRSRGHGCPSETIQNCTLFVVPHI